jgi:hypothetical protein
LMIFLLSQDRHSWYILSIIIIISLYNNHIGNFPLSYLSTIQSITLIPLLSRIQVMLDFPLDVLAN